MKIEMIPPFHDDIEKLLDAHSDLVTYQDTGEQSWEELLAKFQAAAGKVAGQLEVSESAQAMLRQADDQRRSLMAMLVWLVSTFGGPTKTVKVDPDAVSAIARESKAMILTWDDALGSWIAVKERE